MRCDFTALLMVTRPEDINVQSDQDAERLDLAAERGLLGVVREGERVRVERLSDNGAFQALRPATNRTAEARAGEFAEGRGEVATKSARGKSFMISANPVVTLLGPERPSLTRTPHGVQPGSRHGSSLAVSANQRSRASMCGSVRSAA